MWELTTSVSEVSSSSSARRLTAQIESWPSTSRNGSCGVGAASGGAETSSPSPQRVHTRDAGWMSACTGRAAAVAAEVDVWTGAVSVARKGDETWAFDHEAFT